MATAEDIQFHYDVSNEFYETFLDDTYRMYSCAVWEAASTLQEAQKHKLERIASFVHVKKNDSLLDIGCGWGGMMKYLVSEKCAGKVSGLTLSIEQKAYIDTLGAFNFETALCSWDKYDPTTQFDGIVSIGAFEHFASLQDRAQGRQVDIYRNFFQSCAKWSKPDSHLALQTIVTSKLPDTLQSVRGVKFLLKEIFPGSALPSIDDIQQAICGIYEIQELRTIGTDYAKTLRAWQTNIELNKETVINKFGIQLYERYHHYFEVAQENFEGRYTNLVQISLKKIVVQPWYVSQKNANTRDVNQLHSAVV